VSENGLPARLTITNLIGATCTGVTAEERAEVAAMLSMQPRQIPPRYFYDERGSALFERICELDEYYLTRTEAAILEANAAAIRERTGHCDLVELGSGSSSKTRYLLDAYTESWPELRYSAIDVSETMLRQSAAALCADYERLEVNGVVGTYDDGLSALDRVLDGDRRPRLMLFFGSTMGNFSAEQSVPFLRGLRAHAQVGDLLLVGIDLHKDKEMIELAYNDAEGVTAEFNLNILNNLNRRFGGNFVVEKYTHSAVYNEDTLQIEAHAVSNEDQTIRLDALDLEFSLDKGGAILTEISRKFRLAGFEEELKMAGFEPAAAWTDDRDWFALSLARAI
jgi:dimethylhistidine N-methyltransferase